MVTFAGSRRRDLDGQELKAHRRSPKDPILKKGREEGGREEGGSEEGWKGKRKWGAVKGKTSVLEADNLWDSLMAVSAPVQANVC